MATPKSTKCHSQNVAYSVDGRERHVMTGNEQQKQSLQHLADWLNEQAESMKALQQAVIDLQEENAAL